MDLLLDTHAFLWYITGDKQLPDKIVEKINDSTNRCFISIASIWEIVISKDRYFNAYGIEVLW